ncbi:MAG TPA: DUF4190 domain-containing protein [Pseudolysinimonas sp.]|nr:DUF4190 domain-containing protein [Pseudolysinimonas sp.]
MAACANCSRELQPEWKFCIYCGTPTGVAHSATASIPTAAASVFAPASRPPSSFAPESRPPSPFAPESSVATFAPASPVLRAEDIPADEPDPTPAEIGPEEALPRVNVLAVLALILGCLVSPLAALFGHLALSQISHSGERGTAIAWVAIVLGYLSLAAVLVLGISYLVLNA